MKLRCRLKFTRLETALVRYAEVDRRAATLGMDDVVQNMGMNDE